jgi:hypothetical protein
MPWRGTRLKQRHRGRRKELRPKPIAWLTGCDIVGGNKLGGRVGMSISHGLCRSTAIRLVLAGSLVISSVASCSTGGSTVFSTSADPSDPCGREHAAFADSKSFYFEQVAQGAMLGALVGAALGAVAAAAAGGNAGKGAAIGAGAGALTGGAAGYFNARQQQAADQAALSNTVYNDLGRATQEMDRATTTFAALRACRFATADRIKAEFRQGTLSREQAAQQLGDEKQRFDEELALARQYGAKMAEQDQQFRFAADSLVKDDPQAQQALAAMGAGDFVATGAASVRSAPSADATRVASLSKGQRVRGLPDSASADWRKVALDDGTTGYVSARLLASAGAAPAAASPAAGTSAAAPPAAANRNVQVAVAATETLPEKRAAYDQSVNDAAKQSSLSFNLDQTS